MFIGLIFEEDDNLNVFDMIVFRGSHCVWES